MKSYFSWGNYKYLINGAYPKFKNGKNMLELDRGPGFSGNDPTHPEVSGVIIITGMRDLPRDPRGLPNPFPIVPDGSPRKYIGFSGLEIRPKSKPTPAIDRESPEVSYGLVPGGILQGNLPPMGY